MFFLSKPIRFRDKPGNKKYLHSELLTNFITIIIIVIIIIIIIIIIIFITIFNMNMLLLLILFVYITRPSGRA